MKLATRKTKPETARRIVAAPDLAQRELLLLALGLHDLADFKCDPGVSARVLEIIGRLLRSADLERPDDDAARFAPTSDEAKVCLAGLRMLVNRLGVAEGAEVATIAYKLGRMAGESIQKQSDSVPLQGGSHDSAN